MNRGRQKSGRNKHQLTEKSVLNMMENISSVHTFHLANSFLQVIFFNFVQILSFMSDESVSRRKAYLPIQMSQFLLSRLILRFSVFFQYSDTIESVTKVEKSNFLILPVFMLHKNCFVDTVKISPM